MKEKVVDLDRTVYELCSGDPEIAGILQEAGFSDVTKPGMLNTAGRFMTIPKGASMKRIDLRDVKRLFSEHGYSTTGGGS
jgi:hypothetical protein